MFFNAELKGAILSKSVVEIYGIETVYAVGRAISSAGKSWKALIGRLKAQSLSAFEAGAVAAAWLAQNAEPDPRGFNLPPAMNSASTEILGSLINSHMAGRAIEVQRVMKAEGLVNDNGRPSDS